jgi:hypothetical protein
MRIALLLISCLSLVSCATMTTGINEQIHVSTSPGQANATLVCEGHPAGEGPTPVVFTIRRNAGDCSLTLRKEGFEEQTIAIEQGVNPAYWANMIFSPVAPAGTLITAFGDSGEKPLGIGLLASAVVIFGTDFWTGAAHAHKPGSVDVVLKPK